MTPLERIRRYLESTGRADPCRVLLVFGNPLGNPIGDTVIAIDHARYLPRLTAHVGLSVWTSDPEIWAHLHPEVRAISFLSEKSLRHDYDVVVWASTPVPDRARAVMQEAGVVALSWFAGSQSVSVALGDGKRFEAPLPPFVNYTLRIPDVYRALGWRTAPRARVATTSASNVVLVNPYASRAWKSLPARFLERLIAVLRDVLGRTGLSIVVPAQPKGLTACGRRRVRHAGRDRRVLGGALGDLACARSHELLHADSAGGARHRTGHVDAASGRRLRRAVDCLLSVRGRWLVSRLGTGRTPTCLHFTLPDDRDAGARAGPGAVDSPTSRCGWRAPPRGPRIGVAATHAALLEHAHAFTRACDRYLRGQSSSRPYGEGGLGETGRCASPPEWLTHLAGELRTLYQDLPALRTGCSAADRRIARARLPHLNALRVARLLQRHAQQQFNRQLIETLVAETAGGQGLAIENAAGESRALAVTNRRPRRAGRPSSSR